MLTLIVGASVALKQPLHRVGAALALRLSSLGLQHLQLPCNFHSWAFIPFPYVGTPPSQKSSIFNVSAINWTPVDSKFLKQCSDSQLWNSIPSPEIQPKLGRIKLANSIRD